MSCNTLLSIANKMSFYFEKTDYESLLEPLQKWLTISKESTAKY